MKRRLTFWRVIIMALGVTMLFGALAGAGLYLYLVPRLPSIDALKDVRLQVPLRIYTRDGKLMAEFGEKKRSPLRISETPDLLIKAHLAAEDDRFYTHPGVDYRGILRALYVLVTTGRRAQGGSTITMQVARNFFLSREKTYLRKVNEILLSLKIERELTKNEILELYLNKMFLGKRAYGVGAAAQVYYGLKVDALSIAQMAMISGLYKAPSAYNPIANPKRAKQRRNYVLRRMLELGYIEDEAYREGLSEVVSARLHALSVEVTAPYVAEMVRSEVVKLLGDNVYTAGYKVYNTIDSGLQIAANNALRRALLQYDGRHGYRGPESHIELTLDSTKDDWQEILRSRWSIGGLGVALVVAVEDQSAVVYMRDGEVVPIYWDGLSWAKPYIDENRTGAAPQKAAEVVAVGDVIRIQKTADGLWRMAQVPQVEGALVSLDPTDGAINALVGGFDFTRSKFNRVTQAKRQPGSNFKPFIYSSALENGFTPATLINDAPVVFSDPGLEDEWRPENYSGKFFGPTRLRQGLIKSRNLVSIRILRAIGVRTAIKYAANFGFDREKLPRDLSLALGSATVTPLELATGYAVFANGGYRVKPYLVERVVSPEGEIIMQAEPMTVCEECATGLIKTAGNTPLAGEPAHIDRVYTNAVADDGRMETPVTQVPANIAQRVITPQNHYLMISLMRDVIQRGTGRRAKVLGRRDLAGKTGTTNDQRDAWFSGFGSGIVTTAWVGFDTPQPLGNRETGGRAALPMWIDFMREALKKFPVQELKEPPGMATVRIDPVTGLLAGANNKNAIFETFRVENVPKRGFEMAPVVGGASDLESDVNSNVNTSEQLF